MAFMPIWKDGVKMIIKSIMTDEDRKALEYMLSLEYAMPYQLLKTKNNRRKINLYNDTSIIFVINRLLFCKELSDVLCGNGDFYYCIDLDYLVSI